MITVTFAKVPDDINKGNGNVRKLFLEYCSGTLRIDLPWKENFFDSGEMTLEQARSLMYFLKMAIEVRENNLRS